jgi:hypothetical protein
VDEIHLPETDGDQKTLMVPAVAKHDGGSEWIRVLDDDRRSLLMDFAGRLAVQFPILTESKITEKSFYSKLRKAGELGNAYTALAKIAGVHGSIGPYDIWWAHRYCHFYTRYCLNSEELGIDEAQERVAARLGMKLSLLRARLSRRDASYLVNAFLVQNCRDFEGEITLRTVQAAMQGSWKDRDLYFRYVRKSEDSGGGPREFDPTRLETDDLRAQVKRLKKDMGLIDAPEDGPGGGDDPPTVPEAAPQEAGPPGGSDPQGEGGIPADLEEGVRGIHDREEDPSPRIGDRNGPEGT